MPTNPKELIAMTLAENYLGFGFADDGEADKVAARVIEVLKAHDFGICHIATGKLIAPEAPAIAWYKEGVSTEEMLEHLSGAKRK